MKVAVLFLQETCNHLLDSVMLQQSRVGMEMTELMELHLAI